MIHFRFNQLENEQNFFDFSFEVSTCSTEEFKSKISNFFKDKFEEINYHIENFEFLTEEEKPFFNEKIKFIEHFDINKNEKEEKKINIFSFLVQENKLKFYNILDREKNTKEKSNNSENNKETTIENSKENAEINEENQIIELRKNVEPGKLFEVIVQTYNLEMKKIKIYPEMSIRELKLLIQNEFDVSCRHQELIYLIYKLDDNDKLIKDYFIRPNGIIFLRGVYLPLVFVDYYDNKCKKIIALNIALNIFNIKQMLIDKFKLDNNLEYDLILNGKTLNENSFLIDSNVQKMQTIYFK